MTMQAIKFHSRAEQHPVPHHQRVGDQLDKQNALRNALGYDLIVDIDEPLTEEDIPSDDDWRTYATSQSQEFIPAQRSVLIADELVVLDSVEAIAKEHVDAVLERLGIKPETATRCQINRAMNILRGQSPRPLLSV